MKITEYSNAEEYKNKKNERAIVLLNDWEFNGRCPNCNSGFTMSIDDFSSYHENLLEGYFGPQYVEYHFNCSSCNQKMSLTGYKVFNRGLENEQYAYLNQKIREKIKQAEKERKPFYRLIKRIKNLK